LALISLSAGHKVFVTPAWSLRATARAKKMDHFFLGKHQFFEWENINLMGKHQFFEYTFKILKNP
jgi:hypothetical protein